MHIDDTRGAPLIRQWSLLRLLAKSRYITVPILSTELNCSRRTIRRDLLVLEAAGFPILRGGNPHENFVRLDRDWFTKHEPQQYIPIRELERAN